MTALILMAIMALQIWACGVMIGRSLWEPPVAIVVGIIAIGMMWAAFHLGYYWNFFARSEGFFSANRLTAALAFLATLGHGVGWEYAMIESAKG